MTTTMSRPVIRGFSGEVEDFAAEHGMTDALFAIYQEATRIFHAAQGVRVELYTDHEDSSWVSVFFVIEGWPLNPEQTQPFDKEWYQALNTLIPRDTVWSIGHYLEWTE